MKPGRIKWMSPKGYGFVKLDEGTYVYAHAHQLRDMEPGQLVKVRVNESTITGRKTAAEIEPASLDVVPAGVVAEGRPQYPDGIDAI